MIRKFVILYWGDIVFYVLLVMLHFTVSYCQYYSISFGNTLLAKYFLLIFIVFLTLAAVQLLFLKKRAMRDWVYLGYGIMSVLFILPFYFTGENFQEKAYVEVAFGLIQKTLLGSNTARLMVWLRKQSSSTTNNYHH